MGLWQSTMMYVKSFYQPDTKIVLSAVKITNSCNRLAHGLRLGSIKIQDKIKSIEGELLKMIDGPSKSRSLQGEQGLMAEIVRLSEEIMANEELVHCCEVIKNEARMLEKAPENVSDRCKLAISTILFSYSALNLSQWINLTEIIPQPHPVINKKNIAQPIRELVEFQDATFYALNVYALEMSYRNQIQLQKINEVGHNFLYDPSKLVMRESKSSAAFALSLEEYEVPEENWADEPMQEPAT